MFARVIVLSFLLIIAGCSQRHSAPVRQGWSQASSVHSGLYRVLPHETLYAVAFRFDLDFRQLAAWNHLTQPYSVSAGQWIRVVPPLSPVYVVAKPKLGTVTSSRSGDVDATRHVRNDEPSENTILSQAPVSLQSNLRSESAGNLAARVNQPVNQLPPQESDSPMPTSSPKVSVQDKSENTTSRPSTLGSSPKSVTLTPAPLLPESSRVSPISTEKKGTTQLSDYWVWPSDGPIVRQFGANQNQKGIDIKGELNQPVYAVRSGVVAYCGSGLPGYGNLIIIKHDEEYLSAYAYNAKMFVEEGKIVKAKQKIAEMGISGSGIALLHFEIRKAGKPVNPILYLGQHKI